MNSDSIVAVLAQMGGKRNPMSANASYLVQVWTLQEYCSAIQLRLQ